MQKTANYQLNQWEESDRILRTEFNEDNARVDAALAGLRDKMAWETIKDIVTAEAASQYIIDLRDVDLTRYAVAFLLLSDNTSKVDFEVALGKITDNTGYCTGHYVGSDNKLSNLSFLHSSYPQVLPILLGGNSNATPITFTLYGNNLIVGLCSLSCSQITKLSLFGRANAPAGLRIKLVGVRS